MKILIIEDEPLIAEDLAADLLRLRPGSQIVATLGSVAEARAFFATPHDFQLIFSDIQLGDGSSFDLFASVAVRVPIIFCTAYDQFAIQAFQTNGIAYLLKPYGLAQLEAALDKYERLSAPPAELEALLRDFRRPSPAQQTLLVFHKEKIIPVRLDQVALFYVRNDTTHLLDQGGRHYPVQQTLTELEAQAGQGFYRASRQHLVARAAIREAALHDGRKLLLHLHLPFAEPITISKEKAHHFLDWLAQH
jgi:two-component system, LytTR family, response regulator LytT